jgi:hypothetical protein
VGWRSAARTACDTSIPEALDLPNPQTGNARTATRWGIGALLVFSAALVTYSLDVAGSVRSMLLAAAVIGVLVGPVVSRCLGTPSLEFDESARPTLPTREH